MNSAKSYNQVEEWALAKFNQLTPNFVVKFAHCRQLS